MFMWFPARIGELQSVQQDNKLPEVAKKPNAGLLFFQWNKLHLMHHATVSVGVGGGFTLTTQDFCIRS